MYGRGTCMERYHVCDGKGFPTFWNIYIKQQVNKSHYFDMYISAYMDNDKGNVKYRRRLCNVIIYSYYYFHADGYEWALHEFFTHNQDKEITCLLLQWHGCPLSVFSCAEDRRFSIKMMFSLCRDRNKIRRSNHRLIFIMGISKHGKVVYMLKQGPGFPNTLNRNLRLDWNQC